MHKLRWCVVFDDSAKKARLLHGCNLVLLRVLLCTTLLVSQQMHELMAVPVTVSQF